jgi:hypothetical protein
MRRKEGRRFFKNVSTLVDTFAAKSMNFEKSNRSLWYFEWKRHHQILDGSFWECVDQGVIGTGRTSGANPHWAEPARHQSELTTPAMPSCRVQNVTKCRARHFATFSKCRADIFKIAGESNIRCSLILRDHMIVRKKLARLVHLSYRSKNTCMLFNDMICTKSYH